MVRQAKRWWCPIIPFGNDPIRFRKNFHARKKPAVKIFNREHFPDLKTVSEFSGAGIIQKNCERKILPVDTNLLSVSCTSECRIIIRMSAG
jgi:hypothetical protein